MLTANSRVIPLIHDYINKLKDNNIYLRAVFVYGSQVNGTFDKYSDIDLAIVADNFQGTFDEAVNLRQLAIDISADISPRPYTLQEYENARQGDFLFDEVIQKGILIYQAEAKKTVGTGKK